MSGSGARWLNDGSIVARVWSGPESVSLFKVQGLGRVQAMGMIPHVAGQFSESSDLRRATIGWQDYRGDAWMYRVVKP